MVSRSYAKRICDVEPSTLINYPLGRRILGESHESFKKHVQNRRDPFDPSVRRLFSGWLHHLAGRADDGLNDHGWSRGVDENGDQWNRGAQTLKAKEFDIAFLSQMISHHQAALQMARQAVAVSSKPATKENAQKVMLAQTAEIAQMTQWLKEWYQSEPSKSQQTLVLEDMKSMTAMPVTNDQSFYEMMIPHHQGAIDMSNLVKGRTENKKVEALADQIINDQTSEIAKYRGVLK